MTQHLLHIHIGPMQTFIAAARRTRDLWFGSWLMSELSKAAARGIAEEDSSTQLIFPAHGSDLAAGSELGVSNKIAAIVADPQSAAQAAKAALDNRYEALIAATSLQSKLPDTWPLAEKQLHSFLEFYWVSYPLNGDYANARQYADALLAARKNTRNFQPVNWDGAELQKSSLNGRMETVTPQAPEDEKNKPAQAPKDKKNKSAQKQYTDMMYEKFRARPGEQLSGVDLLKRLGMVNDNKSRFPSTSHMAAMPLQAQLQAKADDPAVKEKWDNYIAALTAINSKIDKQEVVYRNVKLPVIGELDGGLLFQSRLLDFMEKEETDKPKKALNTFLNSVGISDPNPYYALLVGDGDGMGKAINEMTTADDHRAFSQKLAEFSEAARKFVESKDGAVVYAGGDDVLALLPLNTAVSTTAALAQKFRKMMNGLTFSAGIAIVHHLEPLEDVLELARRAEKEAKAYQPEKADGSKSKKNALAIILNKRSGAPRMVVGQWGEIDQRLTQFATYYGKKELPRGLAYQLRDM